MNHRKNFNKIRTVGIIFTNLCLLFVFNVSAQSPKSDKQELKPNQTIEREMTGKETHRYKFDLKAGEFFQVRVEQKGVDVLLRLLDSNENILATMDSPNEKEGPETLSFIASKDGNYKLEISGFDEKAEKGIYTIKREVSRTAKAKEKRRVEVEKLFVEGLAIRDTEGQGETALKKLEAALQGWQELKDEYLVELTTQQIKQLTEPQQNSQTTSSQPDTRPLNIGEMVERQPKRGEIHAYTIELNQGQVLQINAQEKGVDIRLMFFRVADQQIMAVSDFGFGYDRETLTTVVEETGIYWVVIGASEQFPNGNYQMLANLNTDPTPNISKRIRAERLLADGLIDSNKGTKEGFHEATAKWEKSLILWKELEDMYWQGITYFYSWQNQFRFRGNSKSTKTLQRRIIFVSEIGDKSAKAATLNNIGAIYSNLNQKGKALEYYLQALPLVQNLGDQFRESVSLRNVGFMNANLGENQKALEYYNQSLTLARLVGDKKGEAETINNIAEVYSDLGENQKALEFYNQSLSLRREVNDKRGEAATLSGIGRVYSDLGEKVKALEYYNQSLPLRREVDDKIGEDRTLISIGAIYSFLGEKQKALDYFNQALLLAQESE